LEKQGMTLSYFRNSAAWSAMPVRLFCILTAWSRQQLTPVLTALR
jgi:hypothetical protein